MFKRRSHQPSFYRRALIAIWLLFLCKGVFYCILFPLWEGYDEYEHFAFIQFVATQHELPVPETVISREIDQSLQLVPLPWLLREWAPPHVTHDAYWLLRPQERTVRENELLELPRSSQTEPGMGGLYEGQQGPLYYWLMAPLHWALQTASIPTRVFLLRLANVLLASTIIPIAFVAARRLFNGEHALWTCALLAVMPELFVDSSRVGNQTLAMVLYGVLTLLCLTALDGDADYLLIGTVLGALLLTKAYALAAIPAVCFALIWTVRRSSIPLRAVLFSGASILWAGLVAGWWYIRNLQLVGSFVWISSTPTRPTNLSDLIRYIPQISWKPALTSLAGSFLWFGNWSFLAVRSWMYEVLEFLIILVMVGIAITAIRSLRFKPGSIPFANVLVLMLMFGGFLGALAYHIIVTFINSGVGTTCGWYLYAVAVPGAVLAMAGLTGFGCFKNALLVVLAGSFVALELYATHWLLIPYYTGLIVHTPTGALQSFHPGRVSITLSELLARLHVNRPPLVTNSVVLALWLLYLIGTVGVFCILVWNSMAKHRGPYFK